ncbi:MAG: heme exporter protein CcmD [Pseudomonadota bacterium]
MIPAFDHTGPFIWAAFSLSAIILATVITGVTVRAAAAKARLERLEGEEEIE